MLPARDGGLCRGEAAGLRWRDIEVAAATLTLSRQRQGADCGLVLAAKSVAGNRVLALDF